MSGAAGGALVGGSLSTQAGCAGGASGGGTTAGGAVAGANGSTSSPHLSRHPSPFKRGAAASEREETPGGGGNAADGASSRRHAFAASQGGGGASAGSDALSSAYTVGTPANHALLAQSLAANAIPLPAPLIGSLGGSFLSNAYGLSNASPSSRAQGFSPAATTGALYSASSSFAAAGMLSGTFAGATGAGAPMVASSSRMVAQLLQLERTRTTTMAAEGTLAAGRPPVPTSPSSLVKADPRIKTDPRAHGPPPPQPPPLPTMQRGVAGAGAAAARERALAARRDTTCTNEWISLWCHATRSVAP